MSIEYFKPNMTKRQFAIFKMLATGGRLESYIGGWYPMSGRKLRVETEEALRATKQLVEISSFRIMTSHVIVHKDHVAKWTSHFLECGRKIIRVQPLDDD